jgi:hypothetical protein
MTASQLLAHNLEELLNKNKLTAWKVDTIVFNNEGRMQRLVQGTLDTRLSTLNRLAEFFNVPISRLFADPR